MNKLKIVGITFAILIGLPIVALGGSFTNSLIQGKTPIEAIEIIAQQVDSLLGKTVIIEERQNVLENSLNTTESDIEEIKKENELLRSQIQEQKVRVDIQGEQRKNDIFCEELSKAGSKYLPTKQPLKELYEALLKQNSVTFETAYEEHKDNGAKVLSESEFRIEWQIGKNSRDEKIGQIKPYYDEYMSKCL